jgi:hypothetical protein
MSVSTKKFENISTSSQDPIDPKLKKLRDKSREKVKGIFRFHEVPGGEVTFVYKEFKGEPVEKYTMRDGQIYEVPLGVAKHLNRNGWYPRHAYLMDRDGNPSVQIGEKVRRFSFQSLDFVEDVEEVA